MGGRVLLCNGALWQVAAPCPTLQHGRHLTERPEVLDGMAWTLLLSVLFVFGLCCIGASLGATFAVCWRAVDNDIVSRKDHEEADMKAKELEMAMAHELHRLKLEHKRLAKALVTPSLLKPNELAPPPPAEQDLPKLPCSVEASDISSRSATPPQTPPHERRWIETALPLGTLEEWIPPDSPLVRPPVLGVPAQPPRMLIAPCPSPSRAPRPPLLEGTLQMLRPHSAPAELARRQPQPSAVGAGQSAEASTHQAIVGVPKAVPLASRPRSHSTPSQHSPALSPAALQDLQSNRRLEAACQRQRHRARSPSPGNHSGTRRSTVPTIPEETAADIMSASGDIACLQPAL
mmetsp:Transcript_68987/g.128845  ORF Transcript_68987/g.128845 Transcript_68987/m.128845 type:complete len:347 (-) Transcript_68987:65-1105(-)